MTWTGLPVFMPRFRSIHDKIDPFFDARFPSFQTSWSPGPWFETGEVAWCLLIQGDDWRSDKQGHVLISIYPWFSIFSQETRSLKICCLGQRHFRLRTAENIPQKRNPFYTSSLPSISTPPVLKEWFAWFSNWREIYFWTFGSSCAHVQPSILKLERIAVNSCTNYWNKQIS